MLQPFDDDAAHQKPGNYKKDINPDKATVESGYVKMVENYGDNGPCAQAIDVSSETGAFISLARH